MTKLATPKSPQAAKKCAHTVGGFCRPAVIDVVRESDGAQADLAFPIERLALNTQSPNARVFIGAGNVVN
jgi:hypothetical protein